MNVLTLMTGTGIAQAIPILISPVMSRLYSPEDYGLLAIFLSVVNLLAPVSTGAYEQAIVLAKGDREATNVASLSFTIALGISFTALLILVGLNTQVSGLLKSSAISPWLYLVPITMLLTAGYQVLNYWMIRHKQYRSVSLSRIIQSLASSSAYLALGFGGVTSSGLILGGVAGQILGFLSLGLATIRRKPLSLRMASPEDVLKQAREYQDFPKYNLPQVFLDGLRESSFTFLMSYFFLSTSLGFYAFALRILKTPMNLLGSAIGQVFYQRASNAYNSGQSIWPILRTVLAKLLLIATPGLLVVIAVGPKLFAFVFGPEWEQSGQYARILTPWFLINLISSPVSQVPLILRKQRAYFLIGLGYNLLVPVVFFITAVTTHQVEVVLKWVSGIASLYLTGTIIWFIKLAQVIDIKAEAYEI